MEPGGSASFTKYDTSVTGTRLNLSAVSINQKTLHSGEFRECSESLDFCESVEGLEVCPIVCPLDKKRGY